MLEFIVYIITAAFGMAFSIVLGKDYAQVSYSLGKSLAPLLLANAYAASFFLFGFLL